jgi:hypothetical protein
MNPPDASLVLLARLPASSLSPPTTRWTQRFACQLPPATSRQDSTGERLSQAPQTHPASLFAEEKKLFQFSLICFSVQISENRSSKKPCWHCFFYAEKCVKRGGYGLHMSSLGHQLLYSSYLLLNTKTVLSSIVTY